MLERYLDIPKSAYYGWRSPFPLSFQRIVNNHLNTKDCHGFNPDLENILDDIFSVIQKRKLTIHQIKADLKISRADYLIYYVSFVDLHNFAEFQKLAVFSNGALNTIKSIEREYDKNHEAVGIAKQLEIALEISKNDLSLAALYLAIGTRAISRGLDFKLFGKKIFSDKEIESWNKKVKAFGTAWLQVWEERKM